MTQDPQNDLFKADKRKEQVRQEIERAPKRMRWAARQGLERFVYFLSFYLWGSFIPLGAWLFGADWPGQFTESVIGWSFLPTWVVFGLLVPAVTMGALVERFPTWYDEENNTFTNADAKAEQEQLVADWQAEDQADDERWANRAATAGAMSVVTDHIEEGQLSHTHDGGELALEPPTKNTELAD